MKIVPVVNEDLLEILNEYTKLKDIDGFEQNVHLTAKNRMNEREFFTGNEFLFDLMDGRREQDGFPDSCVGYDLKLNNVEHCIFEPESNPLWTNDFLKKISNLNDFMMSFLCTRNNALACIYPPGGYIAWHNNANAYGHNLIFTWSEKGEGQFKYVDPETKEIVTIQDKPGWQCKAAYFGGYHEPEKIFYHAASTDCWRVTVSYIFSHTDIADSFREDIIEEISSSVE